jgi:hypothetical protein
MWFPPPVPVCRPSSMNFSVPSRVSRASSYRISVFFTRSSQEVTGCVFTSMTPGSGVTPILLTR